MLSRNKYFSFLDGFSGYNQIQIALEDQEKKKHSLFFVENSLTMFYHLGYAMPPPPFSKLL
jgi:hypothetical protein